MADLGLILFLGDTSLHDRALSGVAFEAGAEPLEAEVRVDWETEVRLDGRVQGIGVTLLEFNAGQVVEDAHRVVEAHERDLYDCGCMIEVAAVAAGRGWLCLGFHNFMADIVVEDL